MSYQVGLPAHYGNTVGQFPPPPAPGSYPALPNPPGVAPGVYTQPYDCCPIPDIPRVTSFVDTCPNKLGVTKRVYEVIAIPVFVVDTGVSMSYGFGATLSGALDAAPVSGSVTIDSDALTTSVIRDITVKWDPFADEIDDAASLAEALRSYGGSYVGINAATLIFDLIPFPLNVPLSDVAFVIGVYAFWVGVTAYFVSPLVQADNEVLIAATLIPSSATRLTIIGPSRALAAAGYTTGAGVPFVYVWTGIIDLLIERNTTIGNVSCCPPFGPAVPGI